MSRDKADRVSGGLKNKTIGDDSVNAPSSPAASRVFVPQGAQVPSQPLSQGAAGGAAGGPFDGEFSPAVPAPVVIDGQN
jgi:hypothetical protein